MILSEKGMMYMRKYFSLLIIVLIANNIALSNVTVSIGDVQVDGYTNDIVVPVTLTNPDNWVGGLQFDLIALPTIVTLSGSTPVDESSFSADYTVFNDGASRVVFYNSVGGAIAPGGDDIVLNLHYDGSEILSAIIELEAFDLSVSDGDGEIINGTLVNGSITVGDETYLSASSDTGDVSEQVNLDINLQNSGEVGGLQFDISDSPNYLDVTGFTTTDRSTGFSIDFNELENGDTRVIMYSTNNDNIPAGFGPIANLEMLVHDDAYNSNVGVNFSNVTITDGIGGEYWVGGTDSGTVTISPGYIEEPNNLQVEDGLDGQVLLSWDAPIGPIFSRPITIYITTDTWATETTWQLTDDVTGDVVQSYTDAALEDQTEYSWDFDLDFGSYTFTIFDSWGDGIFSPGGYAIHIDGEEIYSNIGTGWTGTEESFQFEVGEGRFVVSNRSYLEPLPDRSNSTVQDIQNMNFTLGIPTTIATGSFTPWEEPITPNMRPVDLDAFKIYRSNNGFGGFEELAEVDSDVTTYLDEDVVNSTTYYYYVTAIYPDGTESGPTETLAATPVEWVELWFDDGASLSGQMDTLNFYLNNESDLGFFYFEIIDSPDLINSYNILTTDRTSDWQLEIVDQGDGSIAITGTPSGNQTVLSPGDGPVCRAVLYPTAEEQVTIDLSYSSYTSIQDAGAVELNWTSESGTYEVGIETQYLNLYGGYGISGSQTTGSVFLQNTQPIYAIEFDIVADPPFINGVDLSFSQLLDLENWELSGTDLGTSYRVTAVDINQTNPIQPGVGHLLDVEYDILGGIPDGTIIDISVGAPVLADINNLPMVTVGNPHSFYIGQPQIGCTIENVSGQLTPGGTGTFEIHVENTETLNFLLFEIIDMPNLMTVTNITPVGRFEAGGTIDGSAGETEDGTFYFLGFDYVESGDNPLGIEPGSGPILEIEVEFNTNISNPSVVFMVDSIYAEDFTSNPLTIVADDFGQFTGDMVSLDSDGTMPSNFALRPNYPNPFNPSTIISYDIPLTSDVTIDVYDMRGRMIKNLVSKTQSAGHHFVEWHGSDHFGNHVGAGVYIYQLRAGNKTLSQKMILMK